MYFTKTRLVKAITDIDGQSTNFDYDPLMRLKSASSRGGNVVVSYSYFYKTTATNRSYVKEATKYTSMSSSGSALTERTFYRYLDGLGRLEQTVDYKHSPTGKDVVTALTYDSQGRAVRSYNPFQSSLATGAYTTVPEDYPHTLTGYESSPLNRVTSQTPPSWHTTTLSYGTNTTDDAVFREGTTTKYAAGTLYRLDVKDPMNNHTVTFTDKKGRVVLLRRTSSSSLYVGADTYQLYDGKDRITTVIPPGATLTSGNLIFSYIYDAADNLLTKKIPDASAVSYRYNSRDQAVLMQDGNLAADSRWIASIYDDYGRIKTTGYFTGTVPAIGLPSTISITSDNELTKNYYDGEDDDNGTPDVSLTTYPQYRGRVRKSFARVLDGSVKQPWIHSTSSYDTHGRLTNSVGNNYQYNLPTSGINSESNTYTYDWADNLLTQTRVHRPSSSVIRTVAFRNTYDAAGRRSNYYATIDAGTEQKLANYTYDEQDLMRKRNLGGTSSTYLQSLDYTYNDQGWLVNINGYNLGGGSSVGIKASPAAPVAPTPSAGATVESNDLFYLALKYDVLEPSFPATARKDGNIAQVIWRTRGRERQAYAAEYDYLSRMTTASYYDLTDANVRTEDQKFKEQVTYADLRGNIASIKRNGMYPSGATWVVGAIDDLTFAYPTTSGKTTSNRLTTVSDAVTTAGKNFGFKPGTGAGYDYDANGNLILDTYKGITDIAYNYLNLPSKSTLGSKTITLVYDATGRKLKTTTAGGTSAENYVQWYADELEYRGTSLEAIYHEEGRVTPKTSTTWQYEYSIRDHLGNTRLTFADISGTGKIEVTNNAATNEVLQENHYTPFGLEMDYTWMGSTTTSSKYRYNSIERNEDFGLKIDMADYRSYDPAIGRWLQVDPLAEEAPDLNPYRFGFNNPIGYSDPLGLFETEAAAKEYAKNNDIKLGFFARVFSGNKISENSDGSFGITQGAGGNMSTSTQDLGGELGVVTGVVVKPNDIMNISDDGGGENNSFFQTQMGSFRDGSPRMVDRPVLLPLGGVGSQAASSVTRLGTTKVGFGALRRAVEEAYKRLNVESLPKFKNGKFGSPQRGDARRGIRYDKEGHPNSTNPNEAGPHINWWDYTTGKRSSGGQSDAVPIKN